MSGAAQRDWRRVIHAELRLLDQAVGVLLQPTTPQTPRPRSRTIEIAPGCTWPATEDRGGWREWTWRRPNEGAQGLRLAWAGEDQADIICAACAWQPRRILRALRRLQAATAWCQARTVGRQRAAAEILRQQARAVSALEAEVALAALRGGGMKC